MAEFNIPLSKIIELAKTQACTYYLECHELAHDINRNGQERREYEREMNYWNEVDHYLEKLQNRRLHP